eukprot:Opistho-1_new@65041
MGRPQPQQGPTRARSRVHAAVRLLALAAAAYALGVVVLIAFPATQGVLIHLHLVRLPFFADLQHPELYGLPAARPFTLVTPDGLRLGGWHVLPAGQVALDAIRKVDAGADRAEVFDNALKSSGSRVVLYLHGNAGTRAVGHRVALYSLLSAHFDAHVVTVDYRGYGDSEGWPSEDGLAIDARAAFDWITARRGDNGSATIVWGHSLGAAVAIRLAKELSDVGRPPRALVVDAPFTRLLDGALHHPVGLLFRWVPYAETLIDLFMADKFPSIERVAHVHCDMLILHGKNDALLPHALGERLHEATHRARQETMAALHHGLQLRFVSFERASHNNIYLEPRLLDELAAFLAGQGNE